MRAHLLHARKFGATVLCMHENSLVRVIYRTSPQVARLVLQLDQLNRYRREHGIGTDDDLAKRIGVHATQVSRVLRGAQPGAKFIAGLQLLFGKEAFLDLFAVEPDNGRAA
jgi:hypothetical protein